MFIQIVTGEASQEQNLIDDVGVRRINVVTEDQIFNVFGGFVCGF